jgi:hypothetical protein
MPKLWHVYHIKNCLEAKPSPKNKFVVIVCRDSKYMGFFINSIISRFVQNRPLMQASQVIIERENHKYLKHDSFVNCTELIAFHDIELTDERGSIKEEAKAEIINAVAQSTLLENRYKKMICSNEQ